jgi:hypothetical protein
MNEVNATYDHELVKRMIEEAVLAEREVVANWIMDKGFATGHGDSIVDLLDQLEWQIAEKEREACAAICDELHKARVGKDNYFAFAANAIRELRAKQ